MLKIGTIIQCYNNKFEVVDINENTENPLFKYELALVNNNDSNDHPYFMGDADIKKHNIKIVKED